MQITTDKQEEGFILPTLETARLLVRPLTLEDAPAIFAYAQDPRVSLYTCWEPHQTLADSLSYLQDLVFKAYARGEPQVLGITLKTQREIVIGTIGCLRLPERENIYGMELAYALAQAYWGQGLILEAATALRAWCLRKFSLKRLQARCLKQNVQSARVLEKLGMTLEGTLRAAIFRKGQFADLQIYGQVL